MWPGGLKCSRRVLQSLAAFRISNKTLNGEVEWWSRNEDIETEHSICGACEVPLKIINRLSQRGDTRCAPLFDRQAERVKSKAATPKHLSSWIDSHVAVATGVTINPLVNHHFPSPNSHGRPWPLAVDPPFSVDSRPFWRSRIRRPRCSWRRVWDWQIFGKGLGTNPKQAVYDWLVHMNCVF